MDQLLYQLILLNSSLSPLLCVYLYQAQTIVNNALKLFSQDKTGMVDFALESGGK